MNPVALPVVIGHKPPLFSFWNKFKQVSYESEGEGFLTLPPYSIYPGVDDKQIGEYHFLFGLRRYLEERPDQFDIVIVEHYRRLLSSKKIGRPTNLNQSHTFAITSQEAEKKMLQLSCQRPAHGLLAHPSLFITAVNCIILRYHIPCRSI